MQYAWGGLFLALVLVAYVPAIRSGWIWDDDDYITHNPTLRSTLGLVQIWLEPYDSPQYYPLVFTSFWIEFQLWGLTAGPYHLTNVLLHGFNAWLIWRLLVRLEVPGAWLAAAVFALHPVHVESVAWVTERKNTLSALFYLTSVLAFLEHVETKSRAWYALALGAFLAALLSKTITCTLPAVLFLLLWWKRGALTRANWLALAPMFVMGVGMGLQTVWLEKHVVGASGDDWSLGPLERCLLAGRAVWFYAGKLLWPEPLIFTYPKWNVDAGALYWYVFALSAIGVLAGLWALRGRWGRGPLVAALVFAGTLFPAIGFFDIYPFRYSFVADHFQYLASVPLIALGIAGACRWFRKWPVLGKVLAVALLLLLGGRTFRQGFIYDSEQTLWEDTLTKNPDCALAHARLGVFLAREERYQEAVDHFTQVVRLHPDSLMDRLILAHFAAAGGLHDRAITEYQTLVIRYPMSSAAHRGLGVSLRDQGRFDEAQEHFEAAEKFQFSDPGSLVRPITPRRAPPAR